MGRSKAWHAWRQPQAGNPGNATGGGHRRRPDTSYNPVPSSWEVHDPRRTISASADHRVTEAQSSIWSSSSLSQRRLALRLSQIFCFKRRGKRRASGRSTRGPKQYDADPDSGVNADQSKLRADTVGANEIKPSATSGRSDAIRVAQYSDRTP